ncbi:unnamed protein product [Phaeothamnion confervicola]
MEESGKHHQDAHSDSDSHARTKVFRAAGAGAAGDLQRGRPWLRCRRWRRRWRRGLR